MTHLKERKTRLIFTSADTIFETGQHREVVVEAHPLHATLRLKGLRRGFDVPWSAIWGMAVKAQVDRERAEKKRAKR